jgi:hypothetical protein
MSGHPSPYDPRVWALINKELRTPLEEPVPIGEAQQSEYLLIPRTPPEQQVTEKLSLLSILGEDRS